MIGEVILENLFEASDLSRETAVWKDIQYATSVSQSIIQSNVFDKALFTSDVVHRLLSK